MQHYLYEEDLKAGDTGAAAVIAAEKEEVAYQQNLKVMGTLLVSSSKSKNFRIMKKRTKELQL